MYIANWIALILTLIGAQNWFSIALFRFNFVSWICMGSSVIETIIYVLVGLASIYLGIVLYMNKGTIPLNPRKDKSVL